MVVTWHWSLRIEKGWSHTLSGRIEPMDELIYCSHRMVYTKQTICWDPIETEGSVATIPRRSRGDAKRQSPQVTAWSLWPVVQSVLVPSWGEGGGRVRACWRGKGGGGSSVKWNVMLGKFAGDVLCLSKKYWPKKFNSLTCSAKHNLFSILKI